MKIDISFKGASFADYERAFSQLPDILQNDAYRRATMRVARRAVSIAKIMAPVDPRGFKDPRKRYTSPSNLFAASVGRGGFIRARGRRIRSYKAKIGAAVVVAAAPHAHLIEWGTTARRTRTGANRGRMPAFHTLERSVDVAGTQSARDFAREINVTMNRVARQLRSGKLSKRTLRAFATLA